MLWRINHDLADGRIEDPDGVIAKGLEQQQEMIEYAVDQTVRFGVDPDPRSTGNPSYWLWFRWWDKWAKNLSDSEFVTFDEAMIKEQDLSAYRPKGDWKNPPVPVVLATKVRPDDVETIVAEVSELDNAKLTGELARLRHVQQEAATGVVAIEQLLVERQAISENELTPRA